MKIESIHDPSRKLAVFFIATALFLLSAFFAGAQTSNQIWFVTYNGAPTPSSDVSVRTLVTDGSTNFIATGAANTFIAQTNFSSFQSPYDIAVDAEMGKVYVLDNNLNSTTHSPEYIYSFDMTGTPSQIAASAQVIYTMPVPVADTSFYPLISGIALDRSNHLLYFNQFDFTTPTNSYIGRLDLASSSKSDLYSSGSGNPTIVTYYSGKIPEWGGQIAIDPTNIYLSGYNTFNGNSGVYKALISGQSAAFSEIVTNSFGDTTFSNGCAGGVAIDSKDNLIYYLTFRVYTIDTNQNAIWVYNSTNHAKTKIASGFQGYPDNITVDSINNHYYFTIGRDATGNHVQTNYQAIYTGALNSTNAPTLLYTPALNGQDIGAGANVGNVAIGGIYVVDYNPPPVAGADFVSAQKNLPLDLPVADLLRNDSDPNGGALSITAVSNASTNGGSVSLNGAFVIYTPLNNFTGLDQFTYTLTNNSGGQAQGTVTVNVLSLNPPAATHLAIALESNDRFFLFVGDAEKNYIVQFADSLNGPWNDLSPILTADANGFIEYNDLISPTPATQFYRIRSSP